MPSQEKTVSLGSGEYTFEDFDVTRYKDGDNWFRLLTDDTDEEFTFDLEGPTIVAPPVFTTEPYFEATTLGVRETDGAFLDILLSNIGGAGSKTLNVSFDGEEVYSQAQNIGSGGYRIFEIDISNSAIGSHTVELSTEDATNVETVERTNQILYNPPSLGGDSYIDATIINTTERAFGMECEVFITNSGGSNVFTEVAVESVTDGTIHDSVQVSLSSGGWKSRTLVVPTQDEGEYPVNVRTDDEVEEITLNFTNSPLRQPVAPEGPSYFDATIIAAEPTSTHTTIHVLCCNSGGESDQTDMWVEDSRGVELDSTTTSILDGGEYEFVSFNITDLSGNSTISVFTIDSSETVDIILGDPTLIERQVSGAITVPEDEGTGLREGEADWVSAGHVGGLAARSNASNYVEHGLEMTYDTDDTLSITGGLAFIRVEDEVDVQDSSGNYTRRWRSGITLATEMPITQNIDVYPDVDNYVYLTLDMTQNNAVSYFVGQGSEEAPDDPHLLIGTVDADTNAVEHLNRAPDITAGSLTADSATIGQMTFEDITATSVTADEIDTQSLILNSVDAQDGNFDNLTATNANIAVADIDDLTLQVLQATTAELVEATIEDLIADSADITDLIADRIEARDELQLPVRTSGYSDVGHGRIYIEE